MTKNEKVVLLTKIWEESVKQDTLAIFNDLIFIKEKNKFFIVGNELYKKVKCLYIDPIFSGIKSFSFFDCQYIEKVELGYNCKEIGEYAFCNSSIKYIKCSKGLKYIGDYAFCHCNLKQFYFEGDILSLGNYAFCECKNLISINLGNKLEYMGKCVFKNCIKLRYAQISGSFWILKESTFYNCEQLKYFVCCPSIQILEDYCFYDCKNLKFIVTTKHLICHEHQVFNNCNNLKTYVIFGLNKNMSWTLNKYMDECFDRAEVVAVTLDNIVYKIENSKSIPT